MCGKGGQGKAVGRSRGDLSTKIHMVTDAQGQPVRFSLTGGQEADAPQAIPLLTGIETEEIIADKGPTRDMRAIRFRPLSRTKAWRWSFRPSPTAPTPGSMTGNCTGPGIGLNGHSTN